MVIDPTVEIDEVRAEELDEIVNRRLQADLITPTSLAETIAGWTRQGLLPPSAFSEFIADLIRNGKLSRDELTLLKTRWAEQECDEPGQAWSPVKLSGIVTARFDARHVEPSLLKKIVERWEGAGVLPPDPSTEVVAAFSERWNSVGLPTDPPEERLKQLVTQWKLSEDGTQLTLNLVDACDSAWQKAFEEVLPAADVEASSEAQESAAALEKYNLDARDDLVVRAIVIEALMREEIAKNLVGLAFSGGGIRSASFNLGLLQALHAKKLLPKVDYLSTVSGGGYIGSFLSASMLNEDVNLKNLPIAVQPDGSQPKAVIDLLRGGKYLKRPLLLFDQYLIGLVLNNLAILGGLIFACATVAYAWRVMDAPTVHRWLSWISDGRILDSNRPFIPACFFLSIWLLAWAVKWLNTAPRSRSPLGRLLWLTAVSLMVSAIVYLAPSLWQYDDDWWSYLDFRSFMIVWAALFAAFGGTYLITMVPSRLHTIREIGNWIRLRLLALTAASILIGIAVWLANPNINFTPKATEKLPSDTLYLTDHEKYLPYIALFLVVCLLPFLRPKDLLLSGERPRNHWTHWVFRVASTAFLVGIPVCVVFGLARHNLSGTATNLNRELVSSDISDWAKFWDGAESEYAAGRATPAAALMQSLEDRADLPKVKQHLKTILKLQELLKAQRQEITGKLSLADRKRLEDLEQAVMLAVNDALKSDTLNDEILRDGIGTGELASRIGALANRRNEKPHFATGELSNANEAEFLRTTIQEYESGSAKNKNTLARNHLLLRAFYPDSIRNLTYVRRTVTIEEDQRLRAFIILKSFLVFVVFGFLVNLNSTSPQRFYRRQLGAAYIQTAHPSGQDAPLTDLRQATAKGAPYHLISGTLNMIASNDKKLHPTSGFLFSYLFCGSSVTGFRRTSDYAKEMHEGLSLADAMSMSGAAFSPLHVKNALIGFLMTVLNVRLGQWMPNPRPGHCRWMKRPTIINVMVDWLVNRFAKNERRRFCLITDGGHNENLGLGQLLRRECSFIIVSDAGQDPHHDFTDFAKLYRRSRLKGIRFEELDRDEFVDMAPLSIKDPRQQRMSTLQYVLARIRYPGNDRPALMIYLKPAFIGKEEVDLQRHRLEFQDFPHDPTANQLYDEDKIESYRQLGFTIGLGVGKKVSDLETSPEHQKEAKPLASQLAK